MIGRVQKKRVFLYSPRQNLDHIKYKLTGIDTGAHRDTKMNDKPRKIFKPGLSNTITEHEAAK